MVLVDDMTHGLTEGLGWSLSSISWMGKDDLEKRNVLLKRTRNVTSMSASWSGHVRSSDTSYQGVEVEWEG